MLNPVPNVVAYLSRPFDDPQFDLLLREFANEHPAEFEVWRKTERQLFEDRQGLSAYPNQQLRSFCLDFLSSRLIEPTGLAASHAWTVLRGRILRAMLDESADLHPAHGKVLITEPRTCSDAELRSVIHAFRLERADIWTHWNRIETAGLFEDDPLRPISIAFSQFLHGHCWVQSTTADAFIFRAVRGLFFHPIGLGNGSSEPPS